MLRVFGESHRKFFLQVSKEQSATVFFCFRFYKGVIKYSSDRKQTSNEIKKQDL